MNDVAYSSASGAATGWTPIGHNLTNGVDGAIFQGHFDGNGHKVSNLTINGGTRNCVGLFGAISNAEIKNLGIETCHIIGNAGVGALVGEVSGISTIKNCYVIDVDISGYSDVGGLTGNVAGEDLITIENCYVTGNVTGTNDMVGGLVGSLWKGTISNSHAICNVSGGTNYIGGLVGIVDDGIIDKSYAGGNVQGTSGIGGLIGAGMYGYISNCYATGNVTGNSHIGGLMGISYDNITDCYATGYITATGSSNYIGGLVGTLSLSTNSITYCYASGNISVINGTSIGGLVGRNHGTIRNCVAANLSVGGSGNSNINKIVGYNNSGTLSHNYAYDLMSITPLYGNGGINMPMDTLKSFNFYNRGNNWYSNNPWEIDNVQNPDKIWGICTNQPTLPFFQWQGFDCGTKLLYAENYEEDYTTEQNDKFAFSVFPNPTSSNITIVSEKDFHTIEIVDILGRTVIRQSDIGQSEIAINVSHLSPGMYFVRIMTENSIEVQKFVKK